MQEVTNQITPLKDRVDKFDTTLQRLFNTNGGPEGFLQSARREDNTRFQNEKEINDSRFDMIFATLQEFKDALKPVTLFMSNQEQKEKDLAQGIKNTEKRSSRNLILLGLAFTAVQIIAGNMQGCKHAAQSFLSDQQKTVTPLNAKGD